MSGFGMTSARRLRPRLVTVLWILATIVSAAADAPVASWVYHSEFFVLVRHSLIARIIKTPGSYYFTLALAAALMLLNRRLYRLSAALSVSGIVAGAFYTIGKWAVGRGRPIFNGRTFNSHPFQLKLFEGGLMGIVHSEPDMSFPSGHACVAFATAAALGDWFPAFRSLFLTIASLVAVERVLEGAHYVSDTVAGAALGMLAWKLTAVWMLRGASGAYNSSSEKSEGFSKGEGGR